MFKLHPMIRILTAVAATLVVSGISYNAVAAATSWGYSSTQSLVQGTLVSLDSSHSNSVVATTTANASKIIGVVVQGASTTIEFTAPGAIIQVADTGDATVLVSDLNGSIKAGDNIGASPLDGIGMKATSAGMTVGIALSNFGATNSITKTVKDTTGTSHLVHIALVKVVLGVGSYAPSSTSPSYIPAGLQALANTISGHATQPWRILASLAIIVIILTTMAVLIYASIHSSLAAIGRNPLSSPSVYKSLLQLGVVIIGLAFAALLGVYLLLAH